MEAWATEAGQLQKKARQLWDSGQHQEALNAAQAALAIYEKHVPPTDPRVVQSKQMIQSATEALKKTAQPSATPAA